MHRNEAGEVQEVERPEISVRVLVDEIARCEDARKRELLIADFFSKLEALPTESYYWNLANTILNEAPERVRPIVEQRMSLSVLLITVRNDEVESLRATFPDGKSNRPLEFDSAETYYTGQLSAGARTVNVFLAQQDESGQQEAAKITTRYVHRIRDIMGAKPAYAVLVGICAGSRRRHTVGIGDVVVPPHIFDESVYKISKENGQSKKIPELRCPGKPHNHLLRLCRGISQNADFWKTSSIEKTEDQKFPPDVHLDPIFTGNTFLEDPGYMDKCRDLYNRKTIAYEMEAGGFANACHSEHVPFVVIRGISDWADEDASDATWRSYASKTASLFTYELLKGAYIPSN